MTSEDVEFDDDFEFSKCCFCEEKYGSSACWNCPEYDGPVPGEEDDEE